MINKSFENLNAYWEKRDTPKTGFFIENQIDKNKKHNKITSEFIRTEANYEPRPTAAGTQVSTPWWGVSAFTKFIQKDE